MQAHNIRSTHPRKERKRVGRGNSSGSGTYSGRGSKGQKARTGGGVRPSFEGGQNRLVKGLPMMRGFTSIFRLEYQEVNLEALARLPESVKEVTPSVLAAHRIVRSASKPVKLLGRGDVSRALQVKGIKTSESARAKVTAAGGAIMEG
ncbi:MAG: 50S ribosomal protein L15 [SAR202 cluster bacterium]|nr:50S ribosomal protein L15 [SAR202 cluster bacterium]